MKKIIILFMVLIFLTGCWDNKDITKQGIVIAMGIDKGKSKDYKITLQIVKPTASNPSIGGNMTEAYWTHSTEGDTISEAINNQTTTISRKPFFEHKQLLIISEEIAREGLYEILDYITKSTEARLNCNVLISKNISPEKILNLKSNLELLPSTHIYEIMSNIDTTNKLISITVFDIVKNTNEYGFNSAIGVIKAKEKVNEIKTIKDLTVEGASIFKDDKLIGWLDVKETRGLQFISGINENSSKGIVVSDKDIKASVRVKNMDTDIKVKLQDEKIKVIIQSNAEGFLEEQQNEIHLRLKDKIELLERLSSDKLKKEMENVIDISKHKYNGDFLSIIRSVEIQQPEYFKKINNNWDRIYKKIDFEVNVNFQINNLGLTEESIKVK